MFNRKKKSNLYLFMSLLFGSLIFLFSVISVSGTGVNSGISAHTIAYFVFSFVLGVYFRSIALTYPETKAALFAGIYGIFIECIQYLIPYREFDVFDILFNFSAAFAAIIPAIALLKKNSF